MNGNNFSRKDFLKVIGMGAAALTLPGFRMFDDPGYLPNLGIQIYTVRKEIEKDFEGTIKKVADIGYKGVETYYLPQEISLERAAKVFKDLNLEVFSMHFGIPVGADREVALRMADAYKCDLIIYHGWPNIDEPAPEGSLKTPADSALYATEYMRKKGHYKNMEVLKKTADTMNEAVEFLKTKGLRFGLHNHWFELQKNDDGILPLYYLKENLSKDVVFEIDTYWAKTAGQDPAKVIKDFGSRVQLLHIKDGPAVLDQTIYNHVPAGSGSMDFPAIVKAGGENIKWMIVEFDEYDKNIFDGIKGSYDYLTKNNLAKGRI